MAGDFERVVAGRAWVRGRFEPVEIGIDEEGRIGRIAKDLRATGDRLDLGDLVLLPAGTDLHAHFRDPGGPDPAESFSTGTEGAALGGVGTVVDMPNTEPMVNDRERWEAKAAMARGRLAVDVVLFGSAESPKSIRSLAPVAGGLKLYLSPTTSVDPGFDPTQLAPVLEMAANSGLPLSVHAEWPGSFPPPSIPPKSSEDWNRTRPPAAETEAVERLLKGPAWLRLHIAHVTLGRMAVRVAAAQVSCEATPHHLLLATKAEDTAFRKTNPPLRTEADRAELWAEFVAGRVPILASDHAPHHVNTKSQAFDKAPSGLPGIETTLPLFLDLARSGRVPLPVVVAAAIDRPARWLGLPVGRIAPGHRANLIAVDFRSRRRIEGAKLRSPAGWSPFEGKFAIFPQVHLRDGQPIVEGGEFVGRPTGRVVRPEYAPARAAHRPRPPPPQSV
ncbi:MAG: dihydroorotase family protein [Thermoplasmata archaeon]|nr:dihydroorotase family protein [Thermoplasmata archaeon]